MADSLVFPRDFSFSVPVCLLLTSLYRYLFICIVRFPPFSALSLLFFPCLVLFFWCASIIIPHHFRPCASYSNALVSHSFAAVHPFIHTPVSLTLSLFPSLQSAYLRFLEILNSGAALQARPQTSAATQTLPNHVTHPECHLTPPPNTAGDARTHSLAQALSLASRAVAALERGGEGQGEISVAADVKARAQALRESSGALQRGLSALADAEASLNQVTIARLSHPQSDGIFFRCFLCPVFFLFADWVQNCDKVEVWIRECAAPFIQNSMDRTHPYTALIPTRAYIALIPAQVWTME